MTTNDESEAFAYEIELIALHGRQNLTNRTDGGDGASGHTHSPESLAKMRAFQSNRPPLSAEARAKIGVAFKGKKLSPEHRAKIKSIANTPEIRAANRAKRLGKPMPAEARAKIALAVKNRVISDETRRKISEAKKAAGSVPPSHRGIKASPETRERQRVAQRAVWARRRAMKTDPDI